MTPLDLTLLPLYRLNNQEMPALPGLLAMTPPRKTARGREQDRLVVYQVLTGNATLSTAEYMQLTTQTASRFFETAGALTSALRAAAERLNGLLLERNLASTGRGQYVLGWLVLAALRGAHCTFLQAGPTHAYWIGRDGLRHIHDTALSGKGLGASQATTFYLSQTELKPGDRLVLAGRAPADWERVLVGDGRPASLESTRRRLFTQTAGDVNAVLIQAQEGTGDLTVLRHAAAEPHPYPPRTENLPTHTPPASPTEHLPPRPAEPSSSLPEPEFPPSAYAIPPQPEEDFASRFPASIPRAEPSKPEPSTLQEMDEPFMTEQETPAMPKEPSETTRQVARGLISGMRASRRAGAAMGRGLQRFLPNLLPGGETGTASPLPSTFMAFIAVAVPLLVVTVASVMYFRFGRSYQYDNYFSQAENARTQAVGASDPTRQRDGWQAVLFYLDKAETYRDTSEAEALRHEAQANLDGLFGIQRLEFFPAFSSGINAQISRLAAGETDLYLLDAERGRVLHASQPAGRGYQLDTAFRCDPGNYGGYQVGPLVDILILPRLNTLNATVLGIDAGGNLLYCAPGQVPRAIPLFVPDTNWGRVSGFTLDTGDLYVLDAQSRAVWVYVGKDSSFPDPPYFFFSSQIPEIEDAIDIAVTGDDLYLLHANGGLTTCSYSRLEGVPTRCQTPQFINNFPAYQGIDLFGQAQLTQMLITSPPDSALVFLDTDMQGVFRFSPRSLELQGQLRPAPGRDNPLPPVPAGAVAVSPNYVLFMAVDDQVFFATGAP